MILQALAITWLLGIGAFSAWFRLSERGWHWLDWKAGLAVALWPGTLVLLLIITGIDAVWWLARGGKDLSR